MSPCTTTLHAVPQGLPTISYESTVCTLAWARALAPVQHQARHAATPHEMVNRVLAARLRALLCSCASRLQTRSKGQRTAVEQPPCDCNKGCKRATCRWTSSRGSVRPCHRSRIHSGPAGSLVLVRQGTAPAAAHTSLACPRRSLARRNEWCLLQPGGRPPPGDQCVR